MFFATKNMLRKRKVQDLFHVEVDGEIIACEHAEFTMHPGALMLYW